MMNRPYGASPIQRQRELDAFEEQRQAYNTAMRDFQEPSALPMARFASGGDVGGNTAKALELMYKSSTGGAPTAEFDRLGGYAAVKAAAEAAGYAATPAFIQSYEISNNIPESAYTKLNKQFIGPEGAARKAQMEADLTSQNAALAAQTRANLAAQSAAADQQAAAENTGGGDTFDIQVVVYGPDGTPYGNPAAARAAGVTNYTMERPANNTAPAGMSITQAYQKVLGRTPAAQELAYWTNQFGADVDAKELSTFSVAAQPERAAVPTTNSAIRQMYLSVLGREPDASGLEYFSGRFGTSVEPSELSIFKGMATQEINANADRLTGVRPVDYTSNLTSVPVSFNKAGLTSIPVRFNKARPPRTGGLDQTYLSPNYTSLGVGAIGDASSVAPKIPFLPGPLFGKTPLRGGAASSPSSYFAMTPGTSTGLAPGTMALGPVDLPLAGGMNTLNALGAAPNLSPGMLGGRQNAGYRTDRLGNRIYAPGAKPLFGFAKGGDVDLKALLAQNAETLSDDEPEDVINTDPLGTAQKMMSDLYSVNQTNPSVSPTRKAIKQTKSAPAKSGSAKMQYESLIKGDLGAMGSSPPALRDTDSAQAQMRELARVYQLKAQAARERGRGFSADTFGAPTLEQPTLTKSGLTKKRFKEGGEAKKSEAESVEEPSIFSVKSYATDAAERMFPGQMGQDDQRDAARHMLAAAIMAKKFGPGTAEFLGKAHERLSNPKSFFNMFGIREPRYDYEPDMHNNRLGAELASRTTSQAELEKLVRAMALQSQDKQVPGKPRIMTKEQLQAVDEKNEKAATPPQYRAEGSSEEGELSQEEIDAASRPAFVTPSSGKGRKEGEISKQLRSGDAYVNMAKGVTELPYDLAGAPMDLVMMARQGLTGQAPAGQVGTSDYIKQKMTGLGIRPAPPADPAAKGFYTAGELLSNLVNPAAPVRGAVKVAEKTGEAAKMLAKELGPTAVRMGEGYLQNQGLMLNAVRPTGSTMLTGPVGLDNDVGQVDRILQSGISNARFSDQADLIKDFWDKKARNYFTRQFGTPDDPIVRGIADKTIKGSALEKMFPRYLVDSIAMGKTRYKEGAVPEGFVGPGAPVKDRFFPKYPEAMEDLTRSYDQATGLKGNLIITDSTAADPQQYNYISRAGQDMAVRSGELQVDKMIDQGVDPRLINNQVGAVTRGIKDPSVIISEGTNSAKDLYQAFEAASAYNKLTPAKKTEFGNAMLGEGMPVAGMNEADISKKLLSENVRTAIEKGEPIYDTNSLSPPLADLFRPRIINDYLTSLPPRELANIRFEDAVSGALKLRERTDKFRNLDERIRAGKSVPDEVFSDGVSKPLLQFDKDFGLEGFSWKRIEKREATVPEGAYVGHSVGGYEMGGIGYKSEKMEGFNTGKYRIYTLRDNRNRPVTTVEVNMEENAPVVTQIRGNGRATGNVPAAKYDNAVLAFLQDYLKPKAISEDERLLTPALQAYKTSLRYKPGTP